MYKNVTMIDDLPDLSDVERSNQLLPPGQESKYRQFIRGSHQSPVESGMAPYGGGGGGGEYGNQGNPGNQEYHPPAVINMPRNTPTCLEIAEHVMNCPICSKFYNNDKTAYIIAIVMLAAVCIILLKRVLDV